MTREEAIARLEANKGAFVFKETNEALDMAIEALSADTVSREHHDMEVKELKHQIKDREPLRVDVVRCKDCRYYNPIDENKPYPCGYGMYMCNKDDFCSYGERQCNYFGERRKE